MKKAAIMILLLTAFLSLAVAEAAPIDYDGNFEDMRVFLLEHLRSACRPLFMHSHWIELRYDDDTHEVRQYRDSCTTNEGTERPLNIEDFERTKKAFAELLGNPVANYGDGVQITLEMPPKTWSGEPYQPVFIDGNTIVETEYGLDITKTETVIDGCAYLFHVRNVPVLLYLTYMQHEETTDSDVMQPKRYNSIDYRCTAITPEQYEEVLLQTGGESSEPAWTPPVRIEASLQDVVFRTMAALTDTSPRIGVTVEAVESDDQGLRMLRMAMDCGYGDRDWEDLALSAVLNAGNRVDSADSEDALLAPGRVEGLDRAALADCLVSGSEDYIIHANAAYHGTQYIDEDPATYLAIIGGKPVLVDIALAHKEYSGEGGWLSDCRVVQYTALDDEAYAEVRATMQRPATTEVSRTPESDADAALDAESASETAESTATPAPAPTQTPIYAANPTPTPVQASASESTEAPMRYEFSEFRSESDFYASAFSASFEGRGYLFFEDGAFVSFDADGITGSGTYTVEDGSAFVADISPSTRFTDAYVLSPDAPNGETVRLYLSGDALWFDAPITQTSDINGTENTHISAGCIIFTRVETRPGDAAAKPLEMPEDAAPILTGEAWASAGGERLILLADGTGMLEGGDNAQFEGTWSLEGNDVTFSYELYGSRVLALTLGVKDNIYHLSGEENIDYVRESDAEALSGSDIDAYALKLGEPITLPFAQMTFNDVWVLRAIGRPGDGSYVYSSPQDGCRFVALAGTIKNTSGREFNVDSIRAEIELNGELIYSASGQVIARSNALNRTVAPQEEADYYIYANVPEAVADSFTDCVIRFAFNDNFSGKPTTLAKGTYRFEITLDDTAVKLARSGVPREKTCFKECPILPEPMSYVDVWQSSQNTHTLNKVTTIRYDYRPLSNSDTPEALLTDYLNALRADGFNIAPDGEGYTISANGNPLATAMLKLNAIRMEIVPGNEGMTDMPDQKVEIVLSMGDTLRAHNIDMTFEKLDSAEKVFSSITEVSCYHRYYYTESGNPYMTVFGTLTNKGAVPADLRKIYAEFIIDDTYHYRANVTGVAQGASDFMENIAARTSVQYYVYGEVPTSIQHSASRIVLKLGFTDDYSTIFVKNGLPDFAHCDEVHQIELKNANAPVTARLTPSGDLTVFTDRDIVKAAQTALNAAGYNCGTPDGLAGKKTQAAIRLYQQSNGLTVTGTLTGELLDALGLR